MNNKILINFLKIFSFAIILIIIYQAWIFLIKWNEKTNASLNENKQNFSNITKNEIWKTAIAITTNIWIKHTENSKNKNLWENLTTIYKEIFSIEELKNNRKKATETLINKNMFETKEYFYLLKTDFKEILSKSTNKKRTLETIFHQLKLRYNNAIDSIKNLQTQRTILITEIEKINSRTEELKAKLSHDFKNTDSPSVNANIEEYLSLKNDYVFLRTYTVFVNNFLKYYISLNSQNLKLINAINLNKDAIIKWSYVVLPSSWTNILKEYWLLYTEEEYEKMLKEAEKE